MSKFNRGLSEEFVQRLNSEYELGGWWKTMTDDPKLFIAIRDKYLNIYWKGNSLLKLWMKDGKLIGEVHYKYMLRSSLDQNPYLTIENGQMQAITPVDLFYSNLSDIESLKSSANVHASEEKTGIHDILMSNTNILDVEIALESENELSGAKVAQRIDFAALQPGKRGAELLFYEVKRFDNKELRSNGDPPAVAAQLKRYRDSLSKFQTSIADSYRRVCGNLCKLKGEGIKARFLSTPNLLYAIAEGQRNLTINCDVRLVIFGYDEAQGKDEKWRTHRDKLEKFLQELSPKAGKLLLMKGNPKKFTQGISSPAKI